MTFEFKKFGDGILEKKLFVVIFTADSHTDGSKCRSKAYKQFVQYLDSGEGMTNVKKIMNNVLGSVGVTGDTRGLRVEKAVKELPKVEMMAWGILNVMSIKSCPCSAASLGRRDDMDHITVIRVDSMEDGPIGK